jgi:hypothetical protein
VTVCGLSSRIYHDENLAGDSFEAASSARGDSRCRNEGFVLVLVLVVLEFPAIENEDEDDDD